MESARPGKLVRKELKSRSQVRAKVRRKRAMWVRLMRSTSKLDLAASFTFAARAERRALPVYHVPISAIERAARVITKVSFVAHIRPRLAPLKIAHAGCLVFV